MLEEIEQQAHIDGVPIIRKEMESFLRVMLTITKPKRILELGTAVGYSAILMSEAIEKDASIITIENYEKRIVQARDNFKKADKEDVITMLEGDAMEIMPGLERQL
ncbi:MAG: O-methyltransferase [Eubacterium ventriosum]